MLLTLSSCLHLLVLAPDAFFDAVEHYFLLLNLSLIVLLTRLVQFTHELLLVSERFSSLVDALVYFSELAI